MTGYTSHVSGCGWLPRHCTVLTCTICPVICLNVVLLTKHSGWIVVFPIHSNRSKMNIARCRSNRDPIEEILTYLASKAWCEVPTVEVLGIAVLHLLPEGMTCGITYKHSTDPLPDQRKSIQRIRRTCRVSAGKHGPHICTSQSMVKAKSH